MIPAKPLRILMITTSFPRTPGDLAGHMVMSLARALVTGEGCQVTVLAPDDPQTPPEEVVDGVEIRRLQYFWPRSWERLAYGSGIPANLRREWRAWLNLPGFGLAYLAGLKRHAAEAQLVHAHWGPLGALAVATRRWHGKPVVATIHGSDWKSGLAPIRGLTGYAIRRLDGIVTLSEEFQADCLRLREGRGPCPIIAHGVDAPGDKDLRAARSAGGPHPLHLITVGRLIPERRHDLLVNAFARLRKPHPEAVLTIVGDGPQAEPLRTLSRELGIEEAVRMPGLVSTGEVGRFLIEADLYVSPTTVETFGLSAVEAAMHALPAVVTEVGFPARLVGDCAAGGQVVPPGDGEALAQALETWCADPAALAEAGWALRRHAQSLELDWQSVARKTAVFYGECLAAAAAAGQRGSLH